MGRSLVRLRHAVRIALGVFLCVGGCALAGDDFNEQRLEEGRIEYQRRNFIDAIDQFRVAAFGFLDRPDRLSECLARLVLAEAAAGRDAEVVDSLNRFLDVERRFGVYAKTGLEPEARANFQGILLRRVPAATLAGIPSLANLSETEEQKIARLPAAERRKALRASAKREPNDVRWPLALARDAIESGEEGEARRWVAKALSLDPENAAAKALRTRLDHPAPPQAALTPEPKVTPPPSPEAAANAGSPPARSADRNSSARPPDAEKVLEESRRLVAASRAGDAVPLLTEALKSDPGNRDLRLALLEAACLSRSYGLAVEQVPMSAPFSDREAPALFYAAVALYETGRGSEARNFLQRALPRVSGPLVEEYSTKILGAAR